MKQEQLALLWVRNSIAITESLDATSTKNPPPLKFWPEKKRTSWRSYVALWSAAALLGTAYGAGWLDDLRLPSLPP